MPNEVAMFRSHRNAYDHAIRAAGARVVDVGFDDRTVGCGVRGPEVWELEAAITDRTVAVAYVAQPHLGPPLAEVAAVAHAHASGLSSMRRRNCRHLTT